MIKPLPASFQLEPYGVAPRDVTQMVFQCDPDILRPDVILMPWWQPQIFSLWVERIVTISPNILFEVEYRGRPISIVRSGIGAPQAGDTVLALGCTACERLLFAGSLGGLRPDLRIGDLVIPEVSLAGDGFCRYLQPGFPKQDQFMERVRPDETLSAALTRAAVELAAGSSAALHHGPVYCTDSILAQFSWLEAMVAQTGCIGIEMESAAVFKAARSVGIRAAALLSVSDVPVRGQTLFAGRSQAEKEHRQETRAQILAKSLLECLANLTRE